MSSPLPPDPYAALGVSKDADLSQIRLSYRKLVLKYHPDKIQGTEAEKNKATNDFHQVQQAYELLCDPSRRSRYDDNIKLAELRKERMMRDASGPTTSSRSAPTSTPIFVRREMRKDGTVYEERAPPSSYFDDRDQFDDPLPTASARKHDMPYEKERKPSAARPTERREKASARMSSPVEGISIRTAFNLKAKAAQAKERVRESHADRQEMRDRAKRHERSEKHSGRRAYASEVQSDSDSDTVVPRHTPRSSRRSSPQPMPEPETVKSRSSRGRREDVEEVYPQEKWERHYKTSVDYIQESKRPGLSRHESDLEGFWGSDSHGRRSGSDTERRAPATSRRTKPEDSRRPTMPAHTSAPSNLKPHVEDRIPTRAKTNPYPSTVEREQRSMPGLNRSQTMPVNKSARKDTLPTRGSNLKHSEVQDSGYYSSSNPHTPELKENSPGPTRENSKKKSSTKYQIVTPDSDDDRASRVRVLDSDEENRHRRFRSPEPDRRDREPPRERERETHRERDRVDRERPRERERLQRTESERVQRTDSDTRSRPSRGPSSYSRNEFPFNPTPAKASPPRSGKLFREIDPNDKDVSYSHQYNSSNAKHATYRQPATASYGQAREVDYDYAPGSTFKDHIRYPHSRRPSAQI